MIAVACGAPSWPIAVILPGSASSADFVVRAFGPALTAHGFALATTEPATGPDVVSKTEAMLSDYLLRHRPTLVGGVSLGAHLAASVTARLGPDRLGVRGLLLALPAWTGPPGGVAALSSSAADTVRRVGTRQALTAMEGAALPWVHEEVARSWSRLETKELAATLDATADSDAPDAATLSSIDVPCGLVAFSDDPLHPLSVARQWQQALPHGFLVRTTLAHAGRDTRVLGDLAVSALAGARR